MSHFGLHRTNHEKVIVIGLRMTGVRALSKTGTSGFGKLSSATLLNRVSSGKASLIPARKTTLTDTPITVFLVYAPKSNQ